MEGIAAALQRFLGLASIADPCAGGVRHELRDLNDRIAAVGRSYLVPAQLPFRCECDEPDCVATVSLRTGEYDAIRSRGEAVIVGL